MSPSSVPTKSPKLKAVLDCRHVPIELFGSGQSRFVRKLVYLYIATYADRDGTEAFPGREKIARDCGLTVRGLANVLKWLADHQLIRVESKASRLGTNRYTVLFSEENQARCLAAIENDKEQQRLRGKAEQTSLARSRAAKSRWAKRDLGGNGDGEYYIPPESPNNENTAYLDDEEPIASNSEHFALTPGTECIEPGTYGSHDRPLDRPLDRPRTPSTTPSPTSSGLCASESPVDVVADARLNPLNSSGQGEGAVLNPDCFMAEVTKVLRRYDMSTRTTKAHRDRAIALAGVHSPELFIAALDCWLANEGSEVGEISKGPDPVTGRPRGEERTWVLEYFISSGEALAYIERTNAAFALGVREGGERIEVVCRVLEDGHHLSSEQAWSLSELVRGEDGHNVKAVCGGLLFADSVEEFLKRPQSFVEAYYTMLRGGRPREKSTDE